MKRHIGFFIILTTFCASLLALVMTENVIDTIVASRSSGGDEPYDPARAAALQKKFESLGLPLHDAKYWK